MLQFIVLATAWNILGGYCGYVNFGSAAFFASAPIRRWRCTSSAPTSTAIFRNRSPAWRKLILPLTIPTLIIIGGIVSGLVGLGTGYLTLRLRGAFFAIATLALAVVLQTLIVNWDFVGGSRGAYIIRPSDVPILGQLHPVSVPGHAGARRSSRSRRRASSSARGSATASPPSATTSSRPKPAACRRCG